MMIKTLHRTARMCAIALLLWAATFAHAAPPAPRKAPAAPVILVLGDSLSAAYGIPASKGWVALLRTRLQQQGYPHQVVNAGISGDTSAGGLSRLPTALSTYNPQWVLLELGANDGLRGLPVPQMQRNLQEIIRLSQNSGAKVLLFEMRLPPNYGAYGNAFTAAFANLASSNKIPLLPFFLTPIATDARNFQDDGLHPTAAAQPLLLDAVWKGLKPALGTPPIKAVPVR